MNVTPLAHSSNEMKFINIHFFLRFLVQALMFPCIGTTRAPLCTLTCLLTLALTYQQREAMLETSD